MNNVKISIAFLTKCCKVNFVVLLALLTGEYRAGKDPVFLTRSYINWYADEAIEQMVQYGIPASVTLAQAIFESRCGRSYLARKSNNHFGIKCHAWNGDTVIKSDDTLNECFRKYSSVEESYTDHSLFLRSRTRYANLFALSITDYKSWCYGLKNCGYATFSGYANELIKIIEENKLYVFDSYEVIPSSIKRLSAPKEIIRSSLPLAGFSLKEIARCDALFINVHDAVIQSLDLVTNPGELNEDIADK